VSDLYNSFLLFELDKMRCLVGGFEQPCFTDELLSRLINMTKWFYDHNNYNQSLVDSHYYKKNEYLFPELLNDSVCGGKGQPGLFPIGVAASAFGGSASCADIAKAAIVEKGGCFSLNLCRAPNNNTCEGKLTTAYIFIGITLLLAFVAACAFLVCVRRNKTSQGSEQEYLNLKNTSYTST